LEALSHPDGINGEDFASFQMSSVCDRWIGLDLTVLDWFGFLRKGVRIKLTSYELRGVEDESHAS